MYWYNCFGVGGDGCFDFVGIKVKIGDCYIYKNWFSFYIINGFCCGKKGKGGGNYFVFWVNV